MSLQYETMQVQAFAHTLIMHLQAFAHPLITAVVGIVVGTFVKEPIKKWWSNRGSLGEKRVALYDAIADFYTAVEAYLVTRKMFLETKENDVRTEQMTYISKLFYEQMVAGKYDALLKKVQGSRTSMGAEVEGFEKLMWLVCALPGATIPVPERIAAADGFSVEFLRIFAVYPFDHKQFAAALRKRRSLNFVLARNSATTSLGVASENLKRCAEETLRWVEEVSAEEVDRKRAIAALSQHKKSS